MDRPSIAFAITGVLDSSSHRRAAPLGMSRMLNNTPALFPSAPVVGISSVGAIIDSSTCSSSRPAISGLSLSTMAVLGHLVANNRLKVGSRASRTFWSSRSDTGRAADEFSRGFWEEKVCGWLDASGNWHPGLWERRSQTNSGWVQQQWLSHYRMDKATFYWLYNRFGVGLSKVDTRYRFAVDGRKRFAILLDWFATGASYTTLAGKYDVSRVLISRIITQGVPHLRVRLVPEFLKLPSSGELRWGIREFERLCHLPGVCGALDGTFMEIQKPSLCGNEYYCYKGFYAIVLLAVVDAAGKFLWVDAGGLGKLGDAACWNVSDLKAAMSAGEAFRAPARQVCVPAVGNARARGARQQQQQQEMSHLPYLVADSAFALGPRLMKCYANPTQWYQLAFNYCVVRTRRVVEQAFGRLKGRWQVLTSFRYNDPVFARKVAWVCCALHNALESRRVAYIGGMGSEQQGTEQQQAPNLVPDSRAKNLRDALALEVLPKVWSAIKYGLDRQEYTW